MYGTVEPTLIFASSCALPSAPSRTLSQPVPVSVISTYGTVFVLAEMTPSVVVPDLVAFVAGVDLGTGFGEVFGIGDGDAVGIADGIASVVPLNGSRASFEVTVSR